ncbi:hypothetical protein ACMUMQ_11640 [Marinomonas sp. 2405UD66-6]|uniref:hypothetical protein n=1 Tax=Marinomonas sp. 2405UD66-6 TaxID=3391834 RepID=UPI0039C94DA9
MPSSNPSGAMDIEIVSPVDGRGETYSFLGICIGTLVLAGGLLSMLYDPTHMELSELPNSHSNLATQVSNALEEITLLVEVGAIEAPYDLHKLPLPTLGNTSFVQHDEHCFTLLHEGVLFSVEHEQADWHAQWAKSDKISDCHATLEWHELTL